MYFNLFPIFERDNQNHHLFIHFNKGFHIKNSFLFPKRDRSFPLIRQENIEGGNIKTREILFHGLNLSSKRRKLRRLTYQVDVHKSELFICHQNRSSEYKSRTYRRRLLLVSNESKMLDTIGRLIKKFKSPDTYTGKGLFFRADTYYVKKGKEYKR